MMMMKKKNERVLPQETKPLTRYTRLARYYDSIYNQVLSYKSQTDLIERIFEKFHKGKIRTVLDVACGTGNLTFLFASKGYRTTGIDLSADMIQVANEKLKLRGKSANSPRGNPAFFRMDMRRVKLPQKYDAALVLFGGFGYLLENNDVVSFFRAMKTHLSEDGLLIFEFWHVSGLFP